MRFRDGAFVGRPNNAEEGIQPIKRYLIRQVRRLAQHEPGDQSRPTRPA
jgi:hypothetical protein